MLPVLIMSPDQKVCESIVNYLGSYNYKVAVTDSFHSCLVELTEGFYRVIIYDTSGNLSTGIEQTAEIVYRFPDVNLILILENPLVEDAVKGMKNGASDILYKPLNLPYLLQELESLEKGDDDITEGVKLTRGRETLSMSQIAGRSENLKSIISEVEKFAATDVNFLLTGPSGAGKGVLARAIHMESPRRDKSFIEINCSAVPQYLFESELFGHEKGSFTDAYRTTGGLIEKASGGTMFLDEIADIPLEIQSKLLKVIEEKKFFRIGGTSEINVDVRFIAATNRDIDNSIKEGTFRKDLFFRIARATVELPSLKERREDIIPMAEYFMNNFAMQLGREMAGMTDQVRDALLKYNWPGNIRELKNLVERMVITCQDELLTSLDLPPELGGQDIGKTELHEMITLKELEKRHILNTLNSVDGNKNRAAEILGIGRSTLFDKLRQFEEEDKQK